MTEPRITDRGIMGDVPLTQEKAQERMYKLAEHIRVLQAISLVVDQHLQKAFEEKSELFSDFPTLKFKRTETK